MVGKTSYNIKKLKFGWKHLKWALPTYCHFTKFEIGSIPKKFPIKTILERTDSSIKNLGQVESTVFKSVLIRNFFVMNQFVWKKG